MKILHLPFALLSLLALPPSLYAASPLPDAPSSARRSTPTPNAEIPTAPAPVLLDLPLHHLSSSLALTAIEESNTAALNLDPDLRDQPQAPAPQPQADPIRRPGDRDANGNPIPLERQQPQRILGFMPNFRTVSGGAKPVPPSFKTNFTIATHQALDYSTFLFLGLTSITAEGMDSHPALGKGIPGFWAYTWRGFLDKTDNTYLSAWLLPSILHEDTRYYALGTGHTIPTRILYVISRQAVTRTYGGRDTPNIAGLGGKVLTQVVSRSYYPASAADFPTLATKFGYSVMRDVGFSSIREFYPDVAAHYVKKHRAKMAALAAARDLGTTPPTKP